MTNEPARRAEENEGAAPLFVGGGETGRLLLERNWAETSLGPIEDWPQSLKTTVGIVLQSPVPMVVLWGEAGVMIYNDAYSVFSGERHPAIFGAEVRTGWDEASDFNDNVMRVGLAGETLVYRDVELVLYRHGYPEHVWLDLDYMPVRDEAGRPRGVLAILRETTDRVLSERHAAAEHDRLKRLFEQAPTFMAMLRGRDHVFELANPCYMQLVGERDVLGLPVRDALPELAEQGFLDLLDEAFRTGEPLRRTSMRVSLRRRAGEASETRYLDFVFQPIRDARGEVTQIFVQGSDVTERVEGEARRRLLMDELDHRVKNTLTTVVAIVTRTLKRAASPAEAAEKVQLRVQALARAQDVLTRESWHGADVEAVVASAVQPYAEEGSGRIRVSGPAIRLSARAGLALSLALHELCTNATKYGALSAEGGKVTVRWTLERDAEGPAVRLEWRERGGPRVTEPARTGFGTVLIERGLAEQLGGEARISYPPHGVEFTFRAPLDSLEEALPG